MPWFFSGQWIIIFWSCFIAGWCGVKFWAFKVASVQRTAQPKRIYQFADAKPDPKCVAGQFVHIVIFFSVLSHRIWVRKFITGMRIPWRAAVPTAREESSCRLFWRNSWQAEWFWCHIIATKIVHRLFWRLVSSDDAQSWSLFSIIVCDFPLLYLHISYLKDKMFLLYYIIFRDIVLN